MVVLVVGRRGLVTLVVLVPQPVDPAGEVREDVVDAVVGAVGLERAVFEAPRAPQQAWFVRRFGADVNLGNIALDEVLSLETLRLGLRSDTAAAAVAAELAR